MTGWAAGARPPGVPGAPVPQLTAHGLHARRVGPTEWTYRPDAVGVARDARGRPSVTLIAAGDDAFLNLTTLLPADDDAVAALAKELARREGVPPAELTLRPARLDVAPAELLVGDGDGGWICLARRVTSGVPPYSAAFAVPLSPARVAAVRAALDGTSGQLAARYTLTEAPAPTREATTSSSSSFSSTTTTTTTTSSRGDASPEGGTTHERVATERHDTHVAPPGPPSEPGPIVLLTDAAAWRTT
ncbi:hypothetical protein Bcav_0353 [Beutenbergia cavernae DSM 12333]|uniref:Uncharacterized protein n=1 Tax=Beutenbergia cavernae (strain ATCC BAA-8 / DSM 12333 / CCUG 43141 / JCM 11478 / NBRC 16432 / NCIMB 13614 / HKI 0122) TaxID=471853 RepID=C5BWF9_BEUC1|nr:hypothetical protein [Beutenbergia cavernae]ACQ78617.1 hypothetical protein Bcav_0353 [Beutenbergia cavernae DSM 12333]